MLLNISQNIIPELAGVANKLIDKVSDGIGAVFEPYQMIRKAKAEVEIEQIKNKAIFENLGLIQQGLSRLAREQSNIKQILSYSFPLLNIDAKPENIDNDWIANFFDKCKTVSDEQMQLIWAKLLAGEANSAGSFSRKTVNLIADLDKSDAEMFTKLCSFCWKFQDDMEDNIVLIFDLRDKFYNHYGINFSSLNHLETLGLIKLQTLTQGFLIENSSKKLIARYYNKSVELIMPNDSTNQLEVGQVILTRAGNELANVCQSEAIDEFFDYVYDRWLQKSYIPTT